MDHDEKRRIKMIEDRISKAKHFLEAIVPVFDQVEARRKALEKEIAQLEDERIRLVQGQLAMRFDSLNF